MANTHNDQPAAIRKGEELDAGRLLDYLRQQLPDIEGEISVQQFPSGFSNLTYFVQVGDREMVLRRPPFGANIATAHDMGREYKVLTLLQPHYPKIPRPVLFSEDEAVLGAPFYLMERVQGIILRGKPPKGLDLSPALMHQLSQAKLDNLAALHLLDLESTGLAALGKPEGYAQRQVEGWIKRYYKAETDPIAEMDELAKWMPNNIPLPQRASFIHNDYKYDNLVLHPERLHEIVAVLDWEMATVGDPLMDLGTTLAYWAEAGDPDLLKAFNLTWLPGNLTRQAAAEHYAQKTGLHLGNLLFYYVFGVFKVAVIGQQIYARFKKGHTQDPRFAMLIHLVRACAANGVRALATGKI